MAVAVSLMARATGFGISASAFRFSLALAIALVSGSSPRTARRYHDKAGITWSSLSKREHQLDTITGIGSITLPGNQESRLGRLVLLRDGSTLRSDRRELQPLTLPGG